MDALAQRLRSERERQQLSVRDLSIVTKIREPYIEAVERGAYDVLPAVYVRSFVRTLATALGISSQEISQLMDDVFDTGDEMPERLPRSVPQPVQRPDAISTTMHAAGDLVSVKAQEAAEKATRVLLDGVDKLKDLSPPSFLQQRSKSMMAAIIGGAVVVVALILWLLFSGDDSNVQDPTAHEIDVGELVDSYETSGAAADSMELRAEVLDSAWITIRMDAGKTVQQVMEPGADYAWRAAERFTISLSNAGGVRFYRNDNALPLFGQRGQTVREVVITRTEIRSSNQPMGDAAERPAVSTPAPAPAPQPRAQTPERQASQRQATRQQAAPQRRQRPEQRQRRQQQQQPQQQRRKPVPMIAPAPIQQPDLRRKTDGN